MKTLCNPELVLKYEVDKRENPDAQFAMKKFEDLAGLNLKPQQENMTILLDIMKF